MEIAPRDREMRPAAVAMAIAGAGRGYRVARPAVRLQPASNACSSMRDLPQRLRTRNRRATSPGCPMASRASSMVGSVLLKFLLQIVEDVLQFLLTFQEPVTLHTHQKRV